MHFNRLTILSLEIQKKCFMQLVFQISNNNQKMFTETQHRVHECSEKAMPLVNLLCSNSEFNRVVCRMVTLVSENWNKRVLRVGRGFVHKEVVNA